MKKVFNLSFMVAALAATVLFSSCGTDEDDPDKPMPTLTVEVLDHSGSDVEVGKSETISFRWNAVKAGGGSDLKSITVSQQGLNVTDLLPETAKGKKFSNNSISLTGSDKTQYIDTLSLLSGDNEGTTTYTFKIEDKDGNIVTKVVKVTVKANANETAFENELEGAFWHVQGSKEGAFNLVSGNAVDSKGADTDKDMKNTDKAGDPFTGSFEAGNDTKFVKANSYDFDNATVESATDAYSNGTATSSVSKPSVNDIYIVKLRGGDDYAVIKITSVDADNNDCSCGNKGKISFEYKK